MQALQPLNLMQAVDFAKLQEEKFSELRKYQRFSYSNTSSSNLHTTSTIPPLLSKPPPNVPVKRLSTSELQERRDKGLCYTCDEKFLPGHKCKSKLFSLIHQDDEFSDPLPQTDCSPLQPAADSSPISAEDTNSLSNCSYKFTH